MMSAVRARNTKLEMEVRLRLFAMKFRYRLHVKNLPGTPDLVFPKYGAVIFVHGCFWHCHGCHLSALPKTRQSWWKEKLEGNRKRDLAVMTEILNLGWRVLVIWECSIRNPKRKRAEALDRIAEIACRFLKSELKKLEIPRLSRHRKGNSAE